MTPDIEKIEHLLNAKTFEQLNAAERELVLAHLSGKAEYDHMRETLVRVKKVFTVEAASIQAETDMKEMVLNRFEQNKPKSVGLLERLSIFFTTLIPSPAGRFSAVLGMLALVITVIFFLQPTKQLDMAMNMEVAKESEPKPVPVASDAMQPEEITAEEKTLEERGAVSSQLYTVTEQEVAETSPRMASPVPGAVADVTLSDSKGEANQFQAKDEFKAEEKNAKKLAAEPQQPPIVTNNEGRYEYMNSRVAEVEMKSTYSDAQKGSYTQKPSAEKPLKNKTDAATSVADMEDMNQGKTVVAASGATSGVGTDLELSEVSLANSIPVWPGFENSSNAYELTSKKIKELLAATNAYKTVKSDKPLQLELSFNKKGQVIKAILKGDVDETLKKEVETKALKLPVFKFTKGKSIQLKQTYFL